MLGNSTQGLPVVGLLTIKVERAKANLLFKDLMILSLANLSIMIITGFHFIFALIIDID